MATYKQIADLLDAGMVKADIITHISARTARPIPCDAAKVVLEENGLVVENPITGERSGSLIDTYTNMTDPAKKSLLGWFLTHTFGRGTQLSSDTQPRAVQLAAVLAGLPPAMQAVGQQLLALGGGQPDAGFDSAAYDKLIAQHDAEIAEQSRQEAIDALKAEIENTWINPAMSDGVSDAATVRAAIKAGL